LLRNGRCQAIVTGGAEAPIIPISVAAFNQAGALSTRFNEDPQRGSRPFDAKRDGFVMSEGAGVLILERESYAARRGAKILAEVVGYGASDDAHHITAPPEDGTEPFAR
jgi:3-oxoacyl-[acyl-carrier-protein] synthase II